jgi:hypothetical protein
MNLSTLHVIVISKARSPRNDFSLAEFAGYINMASAQNKHRCCGSPKGTVEEKFDLSLQHTRYMNDIHFSKVVSTQFSVITIYYPMKR